MAEKTPNKKEESAKPAKVHEDQPEYQEKIMFLVSTTAQGFILVWCLLVLSLGYVKLPSNMFGVEIPDQPRIDSTFAAGLLGNILAGWGISVGANNGNKKKKREDEQISARNTAGQQTIVIKQPIELITKQPTATRINDLDKLS